MEIRHKEACNDYILINVPLQVYKKTFCKMVRILHYNTQIKTLIWTPLWIVLFLYEKRKYVRFSQQILLTLLEYLIGYVFMQMMFETWSSNSIKC